MKKRAYVLYLVLVLAFIISGCSSKKSNENTNSASSSGVIKIETHNKPTMLIFDLDGCMYCQKLNDELENNAKVKKLAAQMSIYHINAAKEKKYIIPHKGKTLKADTKTLEYIYGFRGSTPFIVITDSNFKTILKIPGYLKPAVFSKVLKFVLTKAYKKTDINTYLGLK